MRGTLVALLATSLLTACAPRVQYPRSFAGPGWELGPPPAPVPISDPVVVAPRESPRESQRAPTRGPAPFKPTTTAAELADQDDQSQKAPADDAWSGGEDVAAEIETVVAVAADLVGARRIEVGGRRFPMDCSGLVRAAYSPLGVDLFEINVPGGSGSEMIYEYVKAHGDLHRRKRPEPGDIAFFHDTYDRNGNGRTDDRFTHVALVETVEDDGTIILIHVLNSGIKRTRMNLYHPRLESDPVTGDVFNDPIRRDRDGNVLSSELLVAFGRIDFDE